MNIFEKTGDWYKSLPDKKKYVEFLTAILTVPVLLTVIITNVNNINSKNKTDQEPVKKEEKIVYVSPQKEVIAEKNEKSSESVTPSISNTECKKEVGPVEIISPEEGETVSKNPVCIDISYKVGEYCSAAWSYRINNSSWSDYDDNSICIYNLDSGDKKLELRVKSIASDDQKLLERKFIYKSDIPTPSDSISQEQKISTTPASLR